MGAVSSVGNAIGSVFQGIGNTVSGVVQDIGSLGAQLDNSVRSAVPGGWATLGTVALMVAAPYLAPALAETTATIDAGTMVSADAAASEAGFESASAALDAGVAPESLGLPAATTSADLSSSMAALGANGSGTGLTTGAVDSALQQGTQGASLLNSAGTGALTGGTMGAVKGVITGQDPLQSALSGAAMGALTGGALDSLTSPELASQLGLSAPLSTSTASALLAATQSLAAGKDPITTLENTALGSGLSYLGGQANTQLSGSVPQPVASALIGAGTGALGSAIKGGDVSTGLLSGAIGASLGSAINGAKTYQQALSDAYNSAYTPALQNTQTAQAALDNALQDPNYVQASQQADAAKNEVQNVYNNDVAPLQAQVQPLYNAAKTAEANYNVDYAAFQANPTTDNYNKATTDAQTYQTAVNAYQNSPITQQLNDVYTNDYQPAEASLQAASSNLESVYQSNVAPLESAYQTANNNLNSIYQNVISPLSNVSQSATSTLNSNLQQSGLDTQTIANNFGISQDQLNNILNGQLDAGPSINSIAANAPPTIGQADLASTIPVTNPDGSQGFLNPTTGAVYNQDGSLNVAATNTTGATFTGQSGTVAGPGTGIVTVTGYSGADLAGTGGSGVSGTSDVGTSGYSGITDIGTSGVADVGTSGYSGSTTASDVVANLIANQTPGKSTSTAPATGTTTVTTPTTGTATGAQTTTGTGAGTGVTASTGVGSGTTAGTGTGAGTSGSGTGAGTGTGSSFGTGAGTAAGTIAALTGATGIGSGTTSGTTLGSSTMPAAPKGTFSKGTEINLPLASSYAVPVENYAPPTYNPQQLQEIQQAKNGGIIHKAVGGGLPMNPTLMHGRETGHTSLFGSREIPLYNIPHEANGGIQVAMSYQDRTLPEGHNPQFFSEGGLNSIHHRYVTGDGDGTSDSVPAMLANGEFVIPADVVSSIGNGSNDSGAKVLDEFLKVIRAHKQKHDAKHLPPDSKGPLAYLLQAKEKVRA